MKTLLSVLALSFVANAAHAACKRPVDPKKVVVMMSFHEGSEEERGAIEGACARGETLLVLPTLSPEARRVQAQISAIKSRWNALSNQMEACQTDDCYNRIDQQSQALSPQYYALVTRKETLKPDYKAQLRTFLERSKTNGTKVTSLILSGHDGGGHYYGDNGETTMAEISNIAKENPSVFADTSSLLLMGCWSGTPDQVEQWRAVFPHMRVIGGFVGSAPASTRIAAGTYISGLLRGEKNLTPNANKASVQAMLNAVQNLGMVTAGVFVQPRCEENSRSPAYYYISPANSADEIPGDMRTGMNILSNANERSAACMRMFGGGIITGSFDWNDVTQYYQGNKEPENNNELRSLYSYLRNNENCFSEGTSSAPITPDQVLFLRFFQDTKKNFNKFFKNNLEEMYKTLDEYVAASPDENLKAEYQKHKKLLGTSLTGMTRKETLEEISKLTGIYDQVYQRIPRENRSEEKWRNIRLMMSSIDTNLYRLQCMPPTWHEYVENETLATPSC